MVFLTAHLVGLTVLAQSQLLPSDSGRFTLFVGIRQVGWETFDYRPDGSLAVHREATGGEQKVTSDIRITVVEGYLESISITTGQAAVNALRVGDEVALTFLGSNPIKVKAPKEVLPFTEAALSCVNYVARAYDRTKGGTQKPALFHLERRASTKVSVQDAGEEAFRTADGEKKVRRFELKGSGLDYVWWEANGRIVGVHSRNASVQAYRDGYQPAPERDLSAAIPRPNASAYTIAHATLPSYQTILEGDCLVPKGSGRRPAVLIIGETDRDRQGNKDGVETFPYALLADRLAAAGFVTLTCDTRSGVKPAETRYDYQMQLNWLRSRTYVDPSHVSVVAHGEGAVLGGMLARWNSFVAGYALIAPPCDSYDKAIAEGLSWSATAPGLTDAEHTAAKASLDALRAAVQAGTDPAGRPSEWLKTHQAYGPAEGIAKAKCPILLLHGEKDGLIRPTQSEKLLKVLQDAGVEATRVVLPGLGHELAAEGPQLDAALGDRLVEWLKRLAGG